jgi:hypothetical protein
MPLITNNTPLGSAFGGKIASLNYNYQPNSQPSTATITIVSENNQFIEPELLTDFIIPKLNAKTKITQVQYNDDGNSKVLQIELQDRLSFILDKNLILVRGIHSSGIDDDKINGSWSFYQSSGLPDSIRKANFAKGVKIINNIALIGSLRTTLTFDAEELPDGSLETIETVQNAEYINGELSFKDNVRNFEQKVKDQNYSSENAWGYSFSELLQAIKAFGLKVKGSTFFEQNDRYVFSDSGSIRSVLSGCLSKLGKSFYVDPIDESIVITDNSFITKINKNIENIYKGNISNLGATSLNVKKSCTEVTGRHFVVKSSRSPEMGGKGDSNKSPGMMPRPPSTSVFRKVFYDRAAVEIIDRQEKALLKRIAYLYGRGMDDHLIQLYLFSLGKKYNPHNWSSKGDKAFYGGKLSDGSSFLDKTKFIKAAKGEKETKQPWQEAFEKASPHGFDMGKLFGAFPNTRTGKVKEGRQEILRANILAAASPDKVRAYVEDFIFIAKGVFISTPMVSLGRAEGWELVNTRGLKIIGPFRASEKIKTISELAPIQRLFDRIGGNPNIRISNLRDAAKQNKGLGNDNYHYIGIVEGKELLVGPTFNQSYDIAGLLEKNIYLFNLEQSAIEPEQYLVYTNNAEKIINDIEKVCEKAWEHTFEGDLTRVAVKYNYIPRADRKPRTNVSEEDAPGSDDVPTFMNISHKFSNLKLSSRLELDFYEGSVGESQAVLQNTNQVSIEQDGPFYQASVEYFRPPLISDLNVNDGFSSLSCSFAGTNGVSTSISYSTSKYQNIDKSIITQIGSSNINASNFDGTPAFAKNTKTSTAMRGGRARGY